jgi:hypothetical protein
VKVEVTTSVAVVTVSVRAEAVALGSMVSVAASCVAEEDEVPEIATPVPLTAITDDALKCVFVPTIAMGTEAPCLPLAGTTELIIGVGGIATCQVPMETALGYELQSLFAPSQTRAVTRCDPANAELKVIPSLSFTWLPLVVEVEVLPLKEQLLLLADWLPPN